MDVIRTGGFAFAQPDRLQPFRHSRTSRVNRQRERVNTGQRGAKAKSLAEVLAQGKNHPGIYYEYTIEPDDGNTLTGKLWIAGSNLRSETDDEHSSTTAIFIRNSKGYSYMFTSGDKQAIKGHR